MSVTTPPTITDLPTGPSTDRPDTFDPEADAFVAAQQPWGLQVTALGQNVYNNAVDAAASATASDASRMAAAAQVGLAADQVTLATTQAGIATTQAGTATTQAGIATTKAGEAATSATAAANSAASLTASSASSVPVGAGTKAFTVPAGKQFLAGVPMVAASVSTPTNRMFGSVASYSGTTLTLNVTSFDGSGTNNDWSIAPSGTKGATGGTAGGQLTGALDELKGSDLVSAATIDPWSTGGNSMSLTGSAVITAIANAPQAGAKRTLLVVGAPSITASANLVVKGGSLSLSAGDEIDIEAETVTKFRITVRKGDGTPTIPLVFNNALFVATSQVFVARVTGPHRFILEGACGSGSVVVQNSATYTQAAATGGGAGGHVVKTLSLNAGDSCIITLSAGGAGVTKTDAAVGGVNGNAGASNSTITGPGMSLTAGPGGGGKFSTVAGTTLGGLGGTASGGDLNVPGAAAGDAVTVANFNGYSIAATGGAANGYSGVSYRSGTATASGSGGAALAITGGAGVGGASGSAAATGNSQVYTGGAGGLGPSAANSTVGGAGTANGITFGIPIAQVPLSLVNSGSGGNFPTSSSLTSGGGAGSGSAWASTGTGVGAVSTGVVLLLGGSGAACQLGNSTVNSGSVNYAAASGGSVYLSGIGQGYTASSGAAGAACAIVQW